MQVTDVQAEKAILVGVDTARQRHPWPLEDSLGELEQLALTAGAKVVGRFTQSLPRPTNHYLGSGKLLELKALQEELEFNLVVFNDELTPVQQRNLETVLELKVIDRTALILDIFGRHAYTSEGQLQVELAQHEYLLPRLAGQWSHLERLGGGIGTRGPGETQLETDRHLVRRRIQKLKEQLEKVRRQRALYRSKRRRGDIPVVALVGYTNAGKSTLLNALTKAGVVAENKLFSTLDPVTRRVTLPSSTQALVTDTVGFIQKLPPMVVAAFRATLEELEEADLLLHVVDITHRNASEQAQVVERTLRQLNLEGKPRILAMNKVDMLVSGNGQLGIGDPHALQEASHRVVLISAAYRWGLDSLLQEVEAALIESYDSSPATKYSRSSGDQRLVNVN